MRCIRCYNLLRNFFSVHPQAHQSLPTSLQLIYLHIWIWCNRAERAEEEEMQRMSRRIKRREKKQCNWIVTFKKHLIAESRKRRPRLRWVCCKHAVFRQSQRLILPTLPSIPSALKYHPEPSMHAITNLATHSYPLFPSLFIINP